MDQAEPTDPRTAPFTTAAAGDRVHGYVLLVDRDGLRHAVRPSAVLCMSDADACQDGTVLQLSGRRVIFVAAALEEVLAALR